MAKSQGPENIGPENAVLGPLSGRGSPQPGGYNLWKHG